MNKKEQQANSSKNFNKTFSDKDSIRVSILSEALPYIQRFTNKTIVVKYGGSAMTDKTLQNAVFRDLALLSSVGVKIVVIHGGGARNKPMVGKIRNKASFP